MRRRLLLTAAILAACLFSVPAYADCPPGDPDCPLDPPQSEEVNPDPEVSGTWVAGHVGQPGSALPVLMAMPLPRVVPVRAGQGARPPAPVVSLPVPMRYQDPADASDVSCGLQALGMALDGLGGPAPTSASMTDLLSRAGMLYEYGTGVEELAFAAQSFGYAGSLPFHGAMLDDLQVQIDLGRPVVVALGTSGEGQPGHFVTLTGISADGAWVTVNDPALGPQTIPIDEFQALWASQGNSGVVVAREPPVAPDGAPVDAMPWVALMAGVMALVSMTPWGSMRRGVGGRPDAGGGGGGKKAAPAPKPAPKAAPKPAPKPAPAPAYKPAPAPAPKPAPAPVPRARFDDEPAPPIPPRFDTEPDPPPPLTATATMTPTPVATATPGATATATRAPSPRYDVEPTAQPHIPSMSYSTSAATLMPRPRVILYSANTPSSYTRARFDEEESPPPSGVAGQAVRTPSPPVSPASVAQASSATVPTPYPPQTSLEVQSPTLLGTVLGWGNRVFGTGRRINASTNVDIVEVDGDLRVFGPQSARETLGLRPMVNRVSVQNEALVLQSTRAQALGALTSPGMPIGLATNVLVDGARYLTGEYDNVQLAAALTVDTGATIATALVAGAITGALSGALVGGALGFGVGAVPAAIIGGLAGAIGALALSTIFNNTGAREYVVDEVADMYGNWTGQE